MRENNMETEFRSYKSIVDDIIEGMQKSKQLMIEKGVWNDNTTLEEWFRFAGSHVKITEKQKEEYEK